MPVVQIGSTLYHFIFQNGKVVSSTDDKINIDFRGVVKPFNPSKLNTILFRSHEDMVDFYCKECSISKMDFRALYNRLGRIDNLKAGYFDFVNKILDKGNRNLYPLINPILESIKNYIDRYSSFDNQKLSSLLKKFNDMKKYKECVILAVLTNNEELLKYAAFYVIPQLKNDDDNNSKLFMYALKKCQRYFPQNLDGLDSKTFLLKILLLIQNPVHFNKAALEFGDYLRLISAHLSLANLEDALEFYCRKNRAIAYDYLIAAIDRFSRTCYEQKKATEIINRRYDLNKKIVKSICAQSPIKEIKEPKQSSLEDYFPKAIPQQKQEYLYERALRERNKAARALQERHNYLNECALQERQEYLDALVLREKQNNLAVRELREKQNNLDERVLQEKRAARALQQKQDYLDACALEERKRLAYLKEMNNKIQTLFIEREIKSLMHFTNIKNVKSILARGFQPRGFHDKLNIAAQYSDSNRFDCNLQCTSFSISFPNYRMFYNKMKGTSEVFAVIELNAELIYKTNEIKRFYSTNAASSTYRSTLKAQSLYNVASFESMFADLPLRNQLGLPRNYTTNPQAEILVEGVIDSSYIKKIYVSKPDVRQMLLRELNNPKYESMIELNIQYFSPRKDYQHWMKEE